MLGMGNQPQPEVDPIQIALHQMVRGKTQGAARRAKNYST